MFYSDQKYYYPGKEKLNKTKLIEYDLHKYVLIIQILIIYFLSDLSTKQMKMFVRLETLYLY